MDKLISSLNGLTREMQEIVVREKILNTTCINEREKVLLSIEKVIIDYRDKIIIQKKYTNTYIPKVVDAFGIGILYEKDILKITLPNPISKKKIKNNRFITDPLSYMCNQFLKSNNIKRYENCILYFEHNYSDKNKVKDYDNLELKSIIDVISLYFLTDDSGKYIDIHHTSKVSENNYLQLYIIDKSKYIDFITNKLTV